MTESRLEGEGFVEGFVQRRLPWLVALVAFFLYAITLERSRLVGDSILLYQAKTRTPVYVPLPPDVAEILRTVPPGLRSNPRYFFWSGNGHPKSAVADWQRSFPASATIGA